MKITILCTDPAHPVTPCLRRWQQQQNDAGHEVSLLHDRSELTGGDLLFLVSCSQRIPQAQRERFGAVLVLHASDLPRGRGWSPHIWAILGGASEITVCLLEAADPIDSGPVWLRRKFTLAGHELLPEINEQLFKIELELMTAAVEQWGLIEPQPQIGEAGEYMPKRSPEHSRLDPEKSIAEQFDLLRVVDSQRYPAFMDFRGRRYLIRIEKDPTYVAE
ncbi:MAG TPA: formyltransferase family protein [Steroidobacter sp.]|uniref:formyltransferase family protein n=1 Tax=Steroidobacter sp. TaxID=1978227 RepID=UPI002ED783CF